MTLLLSRLPLDRRRVGRREQLVFHAINDLPDSLFLPTWAVMQLGTIGVVPLAALVARASGHPRLATRLCLGGATTWLLSKLVKRVVRRPRPGALLRGTRVRGREARGLGYLSGHAGVALALAVAAWPRLNASGRMTTVALVPMVGAARVYVGAHLPLDVIGGLALGLTVDAVVEMVLGSG